MYKLMLFLTVALRGNFLTYQMIKNIKLPVIYGRESPVLTSYHFLE